MLTLFLLYSYMQSLGQMQSSISTLPLYVLCADLTNIIRLAIIRVQSQVRHLTYTQNYLQALFSMQLYCLFLYNANEQSSVFMHENTHSWKFHHLRPQKRHWESVPAPPTIQFRAQLAGSPSTILHSFRSARSHTTTNRKAGGTGLLRQWGLEDGGHRIFFLLFRQYIRHVCHFFRIYQLIPCSQLTSHVIFDCPLFSGEFLLTRGCDTCQRSTLIRNQFLYLLIRPAYPYIEGN